MKQNRHEDALALLGDKNPTHLAAATGSARRKLQHLHTNGAQTATHSGGPGGKGKSASRGASGNGAGRARADRSEERDLDRRAELQYEAGMCYLRGQCYARQNAFDRAKECYKDAVRINVQCFEAFDQLMKNSLMSPGEEWDFVDSLDFESVRLDSSAVDGGRQSAHEAADFTRNLYLTRLSKYARPDEFRTAIETLSTHYRLANNPDILLSKANLLATTAQHEPALALTTAILDQDPSNFACLPLHLALLYELNHPTALFALAHNLADSHPAEPATWLAVGTYYLLTARIPEARSYFSKASLMDPHFGPAWIGFAHTFAAEGESDQAIAAYSTAARLFQGTHLPQLFLGMQELALDNLAIAREYLTTAYQLCDRDPLLINEIGVCCYKETDYDSAIRHFALALSIAADNDAPASQTVDTRLNLAHALRRAERLPEALEQYDEAIRLGARTCSVFTSKGLVLLELEQPFEATVTLHEGLAISPQDPLASELLAKALALMEGVGVLAGAEEAAVDEELRGKLRGIRKRGVGRRRRGRGSEDVGGDGMELDGASRS